MPTNTHMLTSWNILHEDLEFVVLNKSTVIPDDIPVDEVTMESDLFLSRLQLPGSH